ncbi:Predicted DNA binding protein, contains HTH domain [Halomicrobium zhouii]|uniref:Predicted DNA binding protein, contains HTH domain n=1 Tax=Halomicrobium zhouii TaxID=767519 RepID=A0A1I6LTS8_9EURY|nr:helix-turn-helix domain-containing protein [Halomicrobium zhouii]SFS06863.1 Predicted DNA binding protein, contains HTH domain [Halomicrobium zhouii]
MSLFAEITVPVDEFALSSTLQAVPDATVDIERVIATDDDIAPYFWVATHDFAAFESAAESDETVSQLVRLDEFEDAGLYRADWTESVEPVQHAYSELNAGILEASGRREGWEIRFQFDDRSQLQSFCEFCEGAGVSFQLSRLHEIERAEPAEQYGLTPKQEEALLTAWELGFFDTPRSATLGAVADELDISKQSVSDRIRRANRNWIADALVVEPAEVTAD